MEKVKTSISLDQDVHDYIAALAEEERTNVSQIINKRFLELMRQDKGE